MNYNQNLALLSVSLHCQSAGEKKNHVESAKMTNKKKRKKRK